MTSFLNVFRLPNSVSARLLAGPVLIVMVLAMMVLPLPPFVLDLLFTFNICLSIMVLLVAMFTKKPLDFAAFPAVLLFATLLRLALNVASTRVILLKGHNGPAAAGRVIEAFGQFLVGGNFAVGIVVFIILVLINFMVITKGAGRIAEVGARFTLDAMPGKQMAIDADLNAGLIGEDEARARRKEVAQESEFYGSMDGASKFVRGDAVAGLIIMVIGVVGGLIIGVAQHGLSLSQAGHVYTLLTIGDGLVAQIPALVISTAAGVVVSRVATEQDIGEQMLSQLLANPNVLFLTSGIISVMGLIPNMPHAAFLGLGAGLAGLGWHVKKRQQLKTSEQAQAEHQEKAQPEADASWEDVQQVEPLSLQLGYRLITLVDESVEGNLLQRVRSLRKKFAQDLGFLPPVVHIRDNLELPAQNYRILLFGVEIGSGQAYPDRWLAIDPGGIDQAPEGEKTVEPTFGLEAYWVDNNQREVATAMGYTVVDCSTVVATHISHLMMTHAAQLLSRQGVEQIIEQVEKRHPGLTKDFVPNTVSLTLLHKVLRGLLDEQVPLTDMQSIIESLVECAPQVVANTQEPVVEQQSAELLRVVRERLGAAITQQWFGNDTTLNVIGIDGPLEKILTQAFLNTGAMEPNLMNQVLEQTGQAMMKQDMDGYPPVVITSPLIRLSLSQFLRHSYPQLGVLANTEIAGNRQLRINALIGNPQQ